MIETSTSTETVVAFHRQLLASPRATPGIDRSLDGIQRAAGENWPQLCLDPRTGALRQRMREGPFTQRAFRKPGGYVVCEREP